MATVKFHTTESGDPKRCVSTGVRGCKYSLSDSEHGSTPEEARAKYEARRGEGFKPVYSIPTPKRQEVRKGKLKRSSAVAALGVMAVLATSLTGCSSPSYSQVNDDFVQVCQDQKTQKRVEDKSCESTSNGGGGGSNAFMWYYLGSKMGGNNVTPNTPYSVPSVGSSLSGGSNFLPAGSSAAKGFTSKGGTFGKSATSPGKSSITKGGFGGGGKSGSMGG